MSGILEIKEEFSLAGTKDGTISIGELKEPYGQNSDPVVSIAISLNGDEPDWKVHIPYENLTDVISTLQGMVK
jgi:hypothetical protein